LAGVDVIFAIIVALLFTVWKEDGEKKDLDSELQRINKARPATTTTPVTQAITKVPDHESASEESDEEEEEDEEDSEEEEDDEESDEEEEEDDESEGNDTSSGEKRPAMIAKPSNTGLQAASESGSEGSDSQSSSQGSSNSGSSESS